jgi:hypothetical protein
MALLDILFGRRLASDEEGEQCVGVLAGIPMLGLDALHANGCGGMQSARPHLQSAIRPASADNASPRLFY